MTIQELQSKNVLYFAKIISGLEICKNVTIKMDQKRAEKHFKSLREEYGANHSFVDFYYFRLDEEGQEMVEEELTDAELSYLSQLAGTISDPEEDIIFPLEDTLLRIVCKLNASETLFSTIYFEGGKRERTTWWGNYEQEYICLKDKE